MTRERRQGCVHCRHWIQDHNSTEGCKGCSCAATLGEAVRGEYVEAIPTPISLPCARCGHKQHRHYPGCLGCDCPRFTLSRDSEPGRVAVSLYPAQWKRVMDVLSDNRNDAIAGEIALALYTEGALAVSDEER